MGCIWGARWWPKTGEGRWVREPVIGRGIVVILSLVDTEARRDDIPGDVRDKQEVTVQQVVVGNKLLKVGAGEDGNLAPCTIEVDSDGRFMGPLGVRKVDVAKGGGAGGGGDTKHNMIYSSGSLGERVFVDGVPQPSIALMA